MYKSLLLNAAFRGYRLNTMIRAFIPLLLLACVSPAFAKPNDQIPAAKDAEFTEQAILVFDGNLEITRSEARDAYGFALSEQEIQGEDRPTYMHYLAAFHADSMIKGYPSNLSNLTWVYTNNIASRCPHYSSGLAAQQKFRFYILQKAGTRVLEIKYISKHRLEQYAETNRTPPETAGD